MDNSFISQSYVYDPSPVMTKSCLSEKEQVRFDSNLEKLIRILVLCGRKYGFKVLKRLKEKL